MNHYPEAYIHYLCLFHAERDFFECHEVLEEYWKAHPASPFRQTWVGLIQIAVALYHERRGNVQGAVRSLTNALGNLTIASLNELGMDGARLMSMVKEREGGCAVGNRRYTDLNLPLLDQELIHLCRLRCKERGLVWQAPSDLTNEALIHKHKLRDRSAVIAARKAELMRRHSKP